MTPDAAAAVRAEVASMEAELERIGSAAPALDAGADEVAPVPLPAVRLRRRLLALRSALDAAVLERDPGVAAVGRRVTIAADDGTGGTFSLVLPGDGDPARGWVSVDAPLGAALAGRRAGERALVDAPAGGWVVSVLEVS
jgi:transcription elongation GreA/GreB family factor